MAAYIQLLDGLENYVIQHLITMTDEDPRLSVAGSTYENSALPDAAFLKVAFAANQSVSVGGEILDQAVNHYPHAGDILIAPRRYDDEVILNDGTRTPVYETPAYSSFLATDDGTGWDCVITYDVSEAYPGGVAGVEYVVKDMRGICMVVPRHVLLFHELAHIVLARELPVQAESEAALERIARGLENLYRLSLGLPLRTDLTDASEIMTRDMAQSTGFCP